MKITELKCTACNGEMKVDPKDPHVAVCEYCKTRYVIEYEGNDQVHMKVPVPAPSVAPSRPIPQGSGREPSGGKKGFILALICVFALLAVNWTVSSNRIRSNQVQGQANSGKDKRSEETNPAPVELFHGALAEFVEQVYGKPQEQVTQEELDRIHWLEITYGLGGWKIWYSFDSPYENQDAKLTQVVLTETSISPQQAYRFTGVEKLVFPSELTIGFGDMKLKSLSCKGTSLSQLAQNLKYPELLEELSIDDDIESLDGVGAFSSLRSLTLETDQNLVLTPLAQLPELRELRLECDQVTDYSVLSTLTGLTSLALESQGLKDIGFLSSLSNLEKLEITDGVLIHVKALEGLGKLTELTLTGVDDTQDLTGLEGLTGLKWLRLEIPYGCGEPKLDQLQNLESLYIRNMKNLSFLSNLGQLKTLTLYSCEIKDPGVFASLSQLEQLTCTYLSGELSGWNFITRLPALKELDMTAVSTYEDISALFDIKTLETLILNGGECEIRFDKLKGSESLKVLEMKGMKLYTNVDIRGGGGIYSIDYDKVLLDEHTGFLVRYPNLEKLNLSGNKLTQITAASELIRLKQIDISDNFITDLKPLAQLPDLLLVDATGNPVENYLVLPEMVTVIK